MGMLAVVGIIALVFAIEIIERVAKDNAGSGKHKKAEKYIPPDKRPAAAEAEKAAAEQQKKEPSPAAQVWADLWWLVLLIAVIVLWLGLSNLGEWKVETHDEEIVYQDYTEGTALETDVKFDAVSAEILCYTCYTTSTTITMNHQHYTTEHTDHYAYMLLTDAAGNQAVVYKTASSIHQKGDSYSLGLDIPADEMEALADEINTGGKTLYGTTEKNEVGSQSPEVDIVGLMTYSAMEAATDEAENDKKRVASYGTVIRLYEDGEVPTTQTVTDSKEYVVHDSGVLLTIFGGVLLLAGIYLLIVKQRQKAAWQAAGRTRRPIQPQKKPEPKVTPKPAPSPEVTERVALKLELKEQKAVERRLKEEKAAAEKSPLMKMLPSLSTSGKLAEELLNSDPQALKAAIREADPAEKRQLTDALERELETADPENREILQAVLDFAEEVQTAFRAGEEEKQTPQTEKKAEAKPALQTEKKPDTAHSAHGSYSTERSGGYSVFCAGGYRSATSDELHGETSGKCPYSPGITWERINASTVLFEGHGALKGNYHSSADFNYIYNCLGEMVHSGPDWESEFYVEVSDTWLPNTWIGHVIIGEMIDSFTGNDLGGAFYACENLRDITVRGRHTKISGKLEKVRIIAPTGSSAEEYAQKNGLRFVPLAEELVKDDPQALKTAIREADPAEKRQLTDALERELETADPEVTERVALKMELHRQEEGTVDVAPRKVPAVLFHGDIYNNPQAHWEIWDNHTVRIYGEGIISGREYNEEDVDPAGWIYNCLGACWKYTSKPVNNMFLGPWDDDYYEYTFTPTDSRLAGAIEKVEEMRIEEGITGIDYDCFAKFNSLKVLFLPRSIKTIGFFVELPESLKEVYYDDNESDWKKVDGSQSMSKTVKVGFYNSFTASALDVGVEDLIEQDREKAKGLFCFLAAELGWKDMTAEDWTERECFYFDGKCAQGSLYVSNDFVGGSFAAIHFTAPDRNPFTFREFQRVLKRFKTSPLNYTYRKQYDQRIAEITKELNITWK